jgi:light-regulated signal transduction histidine kinase (bacteriophytochrome)
MEMLIRDVLAYTQAANIAEGMPGSVNAGDALARALANLETSIHESGAEIRSTPLPSVRIQETHLVQVLQNLIGNAVKYHGPETPRIEISAQPEEGNWRISVRDNGIGIAPRYANQIFGIFKRLHSSSQYPGTGVGLAICQKIVERYGGQIRVDSQEGHGSTFSFTLPAA